MFKITFETSKSLMNDHNDYVYEISGKLLLYNGERDEFLNVAKLHAYYIDAEANYKFPLHDIYDAHSDNIYRYFHTLFDRETEEIKPEIEKEFGDAFANNNILVIDRLEVQKKYQGNDYGLVLLHNTIQVYGNASCSYVVLEAFPLQFKNRNASNQFNKKELEGIKKMQKHYGKIGFKTIKNTPFMIYNTSIRHPKLEVDRHTKKVKIIKS